MDIELHPIEDLPISEVRKISNAQFGPDRNRARLLEGFDFILVDDVYSDGWIKHNDMRSLI